jgi:hypothetical protein
MAGKLDLRLDSFGFSNLGKTYAWEDIGTFKLGRDYLNSYVIFTIAGKKKFLRSSYRGMTTSELTDFMNFNLARHTGRPLA